MLWRKGRERAMELSSALGLGEIGLRFERWLTCHGNNTCASTLDRIRSSSGCPEDRGMPLAFLAAEGEDLEQQVHVEALH